jgi:hypothetical protein
MFESRKVAKTLSFYILILCAFGALREIFILPLLFEGIRKINH